MAADQAVGVGARAGPDHAVDRVHDNEGLAHHGENFGGAVGKGGSRLDVHELALLLADTECEHAKDAKRQANKPGDNSNHKGSTEPAYALARVRN